MENLILKSIDELKNSKFSTWVWGGQAVAKNIVSFYKRHGIDIAGYLIERDYRPGYMVDGKEAKSLKDFLEAPNTPPINLIIGHASLTKKMVNDLDTSHIHKFYIMDFAGAFAIGEAELNIYDEQFWNENKCKLLDLRKKLCDEESKEAFDEFVYQKRTSTYWKPFSKDMQYFENNIIKFHDHEVMVDCGCYHGETALEFIKFLETQNINTYKEIIALEPDENNISYIENAFRQLPKFRLIKKGAWDKHEVLRFSGNGGSASRLSEDGSIKVEVDSIDNMLSDTAATFIKIDIEGSELKALQGAQNQIIKHRPKLAVCVYHKKTDLIEIPAYLESLVPDYKFYLRNYAPNGLESVFYAI